MAREGFFLFQCPSWSLGLKRLEVTCDCESPAPLREPRAGEEKKLLLLGGLLGRRLLGSRLLSRCFLCHGALPPFLDKNLEASKYPVNVFFQLHSLFSRKIADGDPPRTPKTPRGRRAPVVPRTQLPRSSDSLSPIFPWRSWRSWRRAFPVTMRMKSAGACV